MPAARRRPRATRHRGVRWLAPRAPHPRCPPPAHSTGPRWRAPTAAGSEARRATECPRTEPVAAPTREGPRPGPAASTPTKGCDRSAGPAQRAQARSPAGPAVAASPLPAHSGAPGSRAAGRRPAPRKHASAARWPAWCRGRAARAPIRGRSRRSARSDPGPSPGRPEPQRGSRLDPLERGTPASGPNASDLGSAGPHTGGPAGGVRSPWCLRRRPAGRPPPSFSGGDLTGRAPASPSPLAHGPGDVGRIRVGIRGVGAPSRLAPRKPVVGPFPQPRQLLGARSRLAPRPSSVAPAGRRERSPPPRADAAAGDRLGHSPGCAAASRDSSDDARLGDKGPKRRCVAAPPREHPVETTCDRSDTGACAWLPLQGEA